MYIIFTFPPSSIPLSAKCDLKRALDHTQKRKRWLNNREVFNLSVIQVETWISTTFISSGSGKKSWKIKRQNEFKSKCFRSRKRGNVVKSNYKPF